ncbi:hypothetical protein AMTRI_Chr06g170840 [Amborella trichopoda]
MNPSLWDRRHGYTNESADASGFHPGSLGSVGFAGSSGLHLVELAAHNLLGHHGANNMNPSLSSPNLGLPSPQHHHMYPPRCPMMGMLAPFDNPTERARSRTYDFIYLPIDFKVRAENSRKLNSEKRPQLCSGESLQCNDPANNSPTNELLCHTRLTPEREENSSSLKGSKSYLGGNSEIHDSFVRNHLPPDFRKETLREFSENERLKPSSAHGFQLESRVFASENVQDVRELSILSFESGEEDVRELSTKTMNSWFKMREGAKKLMKKYSVKTSGYGFEVQVGPKVRVCEVFKHQQRNGQHAWQEATMEDLIFPKYVWHTADPNGSPLSNELKRFYGKAPAIVELCVQAGAPVPEEFRGMMRLDVGFSRYG